MRAKTRPLLAIVALGLCLLAPTIASATSAGPVISVYRFWNRATGTHFYTASESEMQRVVATWPTIFRLEGVAYTVDTSPGYATQPLYRFYNFRKGVHFYTASAAERDDILARLGGTFRLEGVAYQVIPSSAGTGTPVYRFYNFRRDVHFYTASAAERDDVVARLSGTYRLEGIAYWVSSAPVVSAGAPVVCIDPGHQAHANLSPEPIGPGSAVTKPKVAGGTTGVYTGLPEHRFALVTALKLRARLEARGVRVVMTRWSEDVDISNAQRAGIANAAGADVFVRVHADGSTNHAVHGISTLYPSGNSWVGPIEAPSLRAAQLTQTAVVGATGAANRGLSGRSDMAGFNWSTVPAIIVECGFMTNPSEDGLLASDAYQNRLADGIAAGVLEYLGK
jgi:N-acetylmuramoyl-L-alanine amidase